MSCLCQLEAVAELEQRVEAGKADVAALRKAAVAQAAAGGKVKAVRSAAQSGIEVLQGKRAYVLEAASMAQVCHSMPRGQRFAGGTL